MNENYNYSHHQKTLCAFLYIQKAKHCETFIYKYKKPDTFEKQDNLRYIFIYKNQDTLRYAVLHEIIKIGINIFTKIMIFCVT